MTNRYIVSTIPRPNYQRPPHGQPSYSFALAAPPPKAITLYTVEEPFGPIVPQKPSSYPSRKGRSLALAIEVLPLGWHFLPKHPEKNIRFYKSILLQEKSARIENIMNKKNPAEVLYHKVIFTGFVSCEEWGQHPSFLKVLKDSGLHYSYYDYIDAFEKVLFYQNKSFDHSWFLMFFKPFSSPIPSWFLKWWEIFGPAPQILPEPLQEAFRYFSSRFQPSSHGS
nr:hypothetical protein CFP56_69294 [Quercus suber]